MAALFKYDENDVLKFKEEVCPSCIVEGKCIKENRDDHWFLMCPKYHQWKVGYTTFVEERLKYQKEHPEEVEKELEKNKEVAKLIKQQKKGKTTKKTKE